MSEESRAYDIRETNVLKITNIADATVALEECDFSIAQIENQLKTLPFGDDKEWISDAMRARQEILHKRKMVLIKKEWIEERDRKADKPRNEDQSFHARFVKSAKSNLSDETFMRIKDMAMEAGRRLG